MSKQTVSPFGMAAIPKDTSHPYGDAYQGRQIAKYRNRANNHWRYRIELAERLVRDCAMPRFTKPRGEIVAVDVGCSIGTFAIEFAKQGFKSYGIDFDPKAIETAKVLSGQEGVSPTFVCGDVSAWNDEFPAIDIALCFDIFEHLCDDELGAFLVGIRKQMSADGCLAFHTFPTEYDHIFYKPLVWPMVPLALLPKRVFADLAKTYSCLFDAGLAYVTGKTWRERQLRDPHCNLLSRERLERTFKRTGWNVPVIETANLFPMYRRTAKWFAKHAITHRNIYGMAVPR